MMIKVVVEYKDPQLLLIQVEQLGTKMTRELETETDSPPFSER